jgi:hypothetical protein
MVPAICALTVVQLRVAANLSNILMMYSKLPLRNRRQFFYIKMTTQYTEHINFIQNLNMKFQLVKSILAIMLITLLIACRKNEVPPVKPGTDDSTKITSDYREKYTGKFVVDIHRFGSINYQVGLNDTVRNVTVVFKYNIYDSAKYVSGFKTFPDGSWLPTYITFPVLKMIPPDNVGLKEEYILGMPVDTSGALIYQQYVRMGVETIFNTGGFISTDSIYFIHSTTDPHTSNVLRISGRRLR